MDRCEVFWGDHGRLGRDSAQLRLLPDESFLTLVVVVQHGLRLSDRIRARALVNVDLELATEVHGLLILNCLLTLVLLCRLLLFGLNLALFWQSLRSVLLDHDDLKGGIGTVGRARSTRESTLAHRHDHRLLLLLQLFNCADRGRVFCPELRPGRGLV